jgi:hypothetical protein
MEVTEMRKRILPHEPEEELLRASDVAQDLTVLERGLARRRIEYEVGKRLQVAISASTKRLISELIAQKVCRSEEEVIARAVRAFYVATLPVIQEEAVFQTAE